jgi:uridine kinase
VVGAVVRKRGAVAPDRAVLVGISGIDASGKGFITARLAKQLRATGWSVAAISADDWLNLPDVCISPDDYAEHFYEHAIRFDEMFEQLIVPLVQDRGISLKTNCPDAKVTTYREHWYELRNIDIVLLEGIFLFKQAYRHHFDLTVWIDCSFGAALERAIARRQEGLPPEETTKAFETIYFPAQRIHLVRDEPCAFADIVFVNNSAF